MKRTACPSRTALNCPRDRSELFGWVQRVLDVDVPHAAVCPDHRGPLDYLEHVFFERPGDALVCANRGGGKTYYGAVATLLDLLFKPGISVRILGGSGQQSLRMYRHLRRMLERPALRGLTAGRVGRSELRLLNGSEVELLNQSQTAVRGCRVQKLRCDEVDEFEPEVWDAAQFVTQARRCGPVFVRGSIEAISTMHHRTGLMRQLVDAARAEPGHRHDAAGWKLFEWCVLDVMARCEPDLHACEPCPILEPCGGRARRFHGFLPPADVLAQRRRSEKSRFDVEMLGRPDAPRAHRVYPEFDPALHVRDLHVDPRMFWVGGMDFGFRGSTVVLWAQARPEGRHDFTLHVLDELCVQGQYIPQIAERMKQRHWPVPRWIGCDPAGRANSVNGRCAVDQLRTHGQVPRSRATRIEQGVDIVRQMLRPAGQAPRLLVHRRCRQLITALQEYHYNPHKPHDIRPVKDGPDHAADALRYLVVNLFENGEIQEVNYLK